MKKSLFILVLLSCRILSAQNWTQVQDTILQGVTPAFWAKCNSGYLVSDGARIFKMSSYSQPWTDAMTGIPSAQRSFAGLVCTNDTVYALTTYNKIYSSIDEGNNWSELTMSGISSALINPLNNVMSLSAIPGRLILNINNDSCFSSTDGSNWSFLCLGNLSGGVYGTTVRIWKSTAYDSLVLYDAQLQSVDTLYFNATMPPVDATRNSDDLHYTYGFSPSDSTLYRIDRTNYNQSAISYGTLAIDSTIPYYSLSYSIWGKYQMIRSLYLSPTGKGMLNQVFSNDSGQTWTYRSDLRWLGSVVVVGTDSLLATDYQNDGVRLSTDNGASWSVLSPQVNGLYYDNIVATPDLDTLYWRYSTNSSTPIYKGVARSVDGGTTWEMINANLPAISYGYEQDSTITTYDLYNIALVDPAVFLTVNEYSLYRTIDAGQNWTHVTLPPPPTPGGDYADVVGTEEHSLFLSLYAWQVDTFGYYRTNDLGNSWTQIRMPVGDTNGYNKPVRFQIVGMHDTLLARYNQRIYQNPNDHFHLCFSTDNGSSWTDITPAQTIGNADKRIGAFDDLLPMKTGMAFGERADKFIQIIEEIDTTNSIYPLTPHDSLYLYNAGSWSVIQHSGLPSDIDMQALSFDNGVWYLSSDYGVYSSSDDGQNWAANFRLSAPVHSLSSALPDGMQMLDLKTHNGNVISSTHGYGVWLYQATPLTIQNDNPENSFAVFPSPASGNYIYVQCNAEQNEVQIQITDINGKIVKQENGKTIAAGVPYPVSVSGLATGTYSMRIISGKNQFENKFVILH